jgi:hypothetical protein
MALPADFTAPQQDAIGRTFVIHRPTGMRYLVREHKHPEGDVVTYTNDTPRAPLLTRAEPQPQPQAGGGYARATFIEGSEP